MKLISAKCSQNFTPRWVLGIKTKFKELLDLRLMGSQMIPLLSSIPNSTINIDRSKLSEQKTRWAYGGGGGGLKHFILPPSCYATVFYFSWMRGVFIDLWISYTDVIKLIKTFIESIQRII